MGIEIVLAVIVLVVLGVGIYLYRNSDKVDIVIDQPIERHEAEIVEDGPVPARIREKLEKLNSLTKAEIEEIGREAGIELDKRKTKANMIKDLEGHVNHK